MTEMDYTGRQRRLAAALGERKLDAMIVSHLANVRYLCGFTGSAGVLLAGPRPVLFVDGRYAEQAEAESQGVRVSVAKSGLLSAAAAACVKRSVKHVGIEAEHLTVAQWVALDKAVGREIRLARSSGVIEELRAVKEPAEIERLRAAVDLSSHLFRPMLRWLRPGVAERSVAAKLEYAARRTGAEAMSFETIVASGERSALPHGVASTAPLPASGFVVLDYGVILDGYCSDMTRTVHLGKAAAEERSVYDAVLEAQLAGISAVRPGAKASDVDAAARQVLKRARMERHFTHSTGHGVGVEIHELPRVAAASDVVLQPGMVITIEPGVYLAGEFGIRIEDMVVVTRTGGTVLTPAPKALIQL